jgi:hypothetical protein
VILPALFVDASPRGGHWAVRGDSTAVNG